MQPTIVKYRKSLSSPINAPHVHRGQVQLAIQSSLPELCQATRSNMQCMRPAACKCSQTSYNHSKNLSSPILAIQEPQADCGQVQVGVQSSLQDL
jgi:hypothetical protein